MARETGSPPAEATKTERLLGQKRKYGGVDYVRRLHADLIIVPFIIYAAVDHPTCNS